MKTNKISIIGHGFVGKAVDYGFNKVKEKLIIDPLYKNSPKDLIKFKPSFIFICVPTPMGKFGELDDSIICDVVSEIIELNLDSIIVIKSTILPDTIKKLSVLGERIIYNPEFLREKHANYDFENNEFVLLGGAEKHCKKVSELYKHSSRCAAKDFVITDLITASLIKYTINSFLATKVIFFNQIFKLKESLGASSSWEEFKNIITKDSRVGISHLDVPGHDGRFGFGGACFPKDTKALKIFAEKNNVNLSLIREVIEYNDSIRSKYDDLDPRERSQNIKFD